MLITENVDKCRHLDIAGVIIQCDRSRRSRYGRTSARCIPSMREGEEYMVMEKGNQKKKKDLVDGREHRESLRDCKGRGACVLGLMVAIDARWVVGGEFSLEV